MNLRLSSGFVAKITRTAFYLRVVQSKHDYSITHKADFVLGYGNSYGLYVYTDHSGTYSWSNAMIQGWRNMALPQDDHEGQEGAESQV